MSRPRIIFAVLVALLVVGCVMFPIELPDPHPFPKSSLQFIENGKTTKQEISEAFSAWEANTDDGVTKLYVTPQRSGDWLIYPVSRVRGRLCVGYFFPHPDGVSFVSCQSLPAVTPLEPRITASGQVSLGHSLSIYSYSFETLSQWVVRKS